MGERVQYDDDGYLDEIVTNGGAHLEKMRGKKGGKSWFLNCIRADGTSIAVWIEGKVTLVEERDAPPSAAPDFLKDAEARGRAIKEEARREDGR